ncbi:fungal hydrophobin [Pluteus cervinus]|uniref:Fungal hydrophobin n=1 Tax=Pluteus cervinus TaxID=181527 RepID=A0ACD3AJK2_9AGAR|nr:fungal hydrophobin [Pluteus cervinus]
MYTRFASLLAVLPLVASVALPRNDGDCNTGSTQCCNSVQSLQSTSVTQLAGLLGLDLGGLTGLVGLTCSPLSALGLGANSCSQQPVCCTGNTFSGLLSLGCSPLNLNL